ncbi:hypothetical protein AVEN_127379-1 [Araneus ventricosus]|uniref:Uncharacterized protein n=1 Tax=Araneus ventricosus TaxID=182803 RepID=A0A4Y2ES22_ARAVE|nr:hypothetical protein AVEN_127379-1 [Araneus ventricosus]
MGAEIKAPPGTGPYCFHIHGEIYHMVSPLYSNEGNKSGYVQLYIFYSSEASNRRMENNQDCLHSAMKKLDALLRSINPFAESYLQMHQLIHSNPAVNVKMVFMVHPDLDLRRYNAPTSMTEVAAILSELTESPQQIEIFASIQLLIVTKIFHHLISAAIFWFILFYFRMENAVGIPTWNMLKKEDLQNVLGLHSCNIIPTSLLFVMHLAFYTTAENSFNSI